jgi:hypothetical protein
MAKGNKDLGSCIVVVGDRSGELAQTTLGLAREGEIDAVPCADVYGAVTQVARAGGRRVLVVGALAELARENGSFFRIAAANAIRCCCLLDKSRSGVRNDLLAALQAGAAILGDVRDLRGVLKEWLAAPQPHGAARVVQDAGPARRRARDTADTSYEEFRATEAELNALLE